MKYDLIRKPYLKEMDKDVLEQLLPYINSFQCERCGNCCKECNSIVVTENDIERISNHLKIRPKFFIKKYLKYECNNSFSVKKTLPCIFYNKHIGCKINDVKPEVCKSFPFAFAENKRKIDLPENCPGCIELSKTIKEVDKMIQDPKLQKPIFDFMKQLQNDNVDFKKIFTQEKNKLLKNINERNYY